MQRTISGHPLAMAWASRFLFWPVLLAVPCSYFAGVFCWIPGVKPQLQNVIFTLLTAVATCVQSMLTAWPIARCIAATAFRLPSMTKAAFAAERANVGEKVAVLARQLDGGTRADPLLGGMSKVLGAALLPALNQSEELIDSRDFHPMWLQDTTRLTLVLGISMFVALSTLVGPWLLIILQSGIAIVGTTVFLILMGLVAIGCDADQVAGRVLGIVEWLMNHALQGLLVKLIRTDSVPLALGNTNGRGLGFKSRECNAATAQFLTAHFSSVFEGEKVDQEKGNGNVKPQGESRRETISREMSDMAELKVALAGLIRLDLNVWAAAEE